jgi:hypothetical protein
MSASAIASMDKTEWDRITIIRTGAVLVEFDPLYILPLTDSFLAQGRLDRRSERVDVIKRLFSSGPTILAVSNRKPGDGRIDCHAVAECIDRALAALDSGGDGARTEVHLLLVREPDEPGGLLVRLNGIVGNPSTAISATVIFDAARFDFLERPSSTDPVR